MELGNGLLVFTKLREKLGQNDWIVVVLHYETVDAAVISFIVYREVAGETGSAGP